jgi:hypothetical protein
MLESDKAENFTSLLGGAETAGFVVCVFSSFGATGFAISVFEAVFTVSWVTGIWFFSLEISAIE